MLDSVLVVPHGGFDPLSPIGPHGGFDPLSPIGAAWMAYVAGDGWVCGTPFPSYTTPWEEHLRAGQDGHQSL